MATVPTVTVGGTDQTAFIQHKTLYWKLKSLDFTLIDPADNPSLHDIVTVDVPDWHGRVSTVQSHPFRSANGDDHRYVDVTCTNKHVAVDDTAPFDLSDSPNYTTTFPYKDFTKIDTLADQTDLSTAEHRARATVYEPGLLPGMTIGITSVAEGLVNTPYIITEMETIWLRDDSPEYHLEMSVEGVPPVTLGGIIESQGCDCPPFDEGNCVEPDVSGLECLAADDNVYSYTEGGARSGLGFTYSGGNYYALSTDHTAYWLTGSTPSDYRDPGVNAAVGNGGTCCGIYTLGATDYHTGGTPFHVRLWIIGPGTMRIETAPHPGGLPGCDPDCGTSGDIHAEGVHVATGDIVGSDTQPAGTVLTVVLPEHGDNCAYVIDITGATGPWGYGGSNFTPLSTFEPCTPDPGQPITPDHFYGNGSNTDFTTRWPYMPGSLEVYVEGVDWSDQVTETDATIGDFALAYPPPIISDPEPNVEVYYRYPR